MTGKWQVWPGWIRWNPYGLHISTYLHHACLKLLFGWVFSCVPDIPKYIMPKQSFPSFHNNPCHITPSILPLPDLNINGDPRSGAGHQPRNCQDAKWENVKRVHGIQKVDEGLLCFHFRGCPVKSMLLFLFPVASHNCAFILALVFFRRNGQTQINHSHLNGGISTNHHEVCCPEISMNETHLYEINQGLGCLPYDWFPFLVCQHSFVFEWMMSWPTQCWMNRAAWDKFHGHIGIGWQRRRWFKLIPPEVRGLKGRSLCIKIGVCTPMACVIFQVSGKKACPLLRVALVHAVVNQLKGPLCLTMQFKSTSELCSGLDVFCKFAYFDCNVSLQPSQGIHCAIHHAKATFTQFAAILPPPGLSLRVICVGEAFPMVDNRQHNLGTFAGESGNVRHEFTVVFAALMEAGKTARAVEPLE